MQTTSLCHSLYGQSRCFVECAFLQELVLLLLALLCAILRAFLQIGKEREKGKVEGERERVGKKKERVGEERERVGVERKAVGG